MEYYTGSAPGYIMRGGFWNIFILLRFPYILRVTKKIISVRILLLYIISGSDDFYLIKNLDAWSMTPGESMHDY